jgi:hypothetical protein
MPETCFYIQRNVWHLQYHKYIGTQEGEKKEHFRRMFSLAYETGMLHGRYEFRGKMDYTENLAHAAGNFESDFRQRTF